MRSLGIALLLIAAAVSADEPLTEPPITDSDRGHWAFQPLSRLTPPVVQNANWCRTAIDRFILARLEKEKLAPAGEADRATLLRRVCFELTGLPPSLELQDEVFADESPDWYERLVDRLLASPSYGERWAQHWLDVARFAETDGFEHDHVRPNAWRFRDWVIDAHNRDVPLNEFIAMQLAGDELRPGDDSALIATGFLFCGPDMPDINLQEERRHTFLNDMTGTVGSVFLGLQMGCAACHDHKYDPISQADFYRLRACFDVEPLFETHPQLGQVMREKSAKIPVSRLMERGDFRRPGSIVQAAFPRIANESSDAIPSPVGDAKSSGRRTSLANWLTRADNPLATRVLINRIWQGHFGTGLVASSSDFGVMGNDPTHPELLDWLATELPRLDWSRKRLHRLIVTSSVYRQAGMRGERRGASGEQDKAATFQISNSPLAPRSSSLLSHFPRRRLDGEAIRDALLAASGELNRQPGGPGFRPPLPDELVRTLLKSQWPVTPEADQHRRRSVYLFARRNLRYPLFEAFDKPDSNASCPRRNVSTIAPQALLLLNADDSVVAAQRLAARIERQTGSDRRAAVELAYRHILNRKPTADDVRDAEQFLTSDSALADLCLALFNLNEFVYLD